MDPQPVPATGLDEAAAALGELGGKPVEEQLAVLEQVHTQLKESLDEAKHT